MCHTLSAKDEALQVAGGWLATPLHCCYHDETGKGERAFMMSTIETWDLRWIRTCVECSCCGGALGCYMLGIYIGDVL